MSKKYDYKIFPTTFKARLLLGGAFVLGGLMMVAYAAVFFIPWFGFGGLWSFDWFDEIDVRYVNQTDTDVAVYVHGQLEVTVPAGEEVTIGYRKIEWWWHRDVAARDLQGRLIFASRYDKDDLDELDYRIVIDE